MASINLQQVLVGPTNTKGTRKPRKQVAPHLHAQFKNEVCEYFEDRTKKLEIVKTTTTPSGQIIDWIPIESQGLIATPPPPPPPSGLKEDMPKTCFVAELDHDGVEKGPPGTVPVPRKNFETMAFNKPLNDYLSKHRGSHRGLTESQDEIMDAVAAPAASPPPGTHRYGSARQDVISFGCEGNISVWTPWVENSDDFSLLQTGIINNDQPLFHSIEAGWQILEDLYGDYSPHLFVSYTTNGYTRSGNNLGGYNRDVDGWKQVDGTIHPETRFSPTSVVGGQHYQIDLKFQLYQGNWWLRCLNRWIGYYPTSLWQGGGSTFSGLGDHGTWVGFWGEVFDSDHVAGRTKTDMGSGMFPDDPRRDAALMTNLKYQADRVGGMADYNGLTLLSADPDMYRIEPHFVPVDPSLGSWCYVGGPGAG